MYPLIWYPTESVLRATDYASGDFSATFTTIAFDTPEARRDLLEHLIASARSPNSARP
jgi:hypothetical protein